MSATISPDHPLADRIVPPARAQERDATAGENDRLALAGSTTLHALVDEAVLCVQGADASAFLQGQFSNDIGLLDPDNAQWTAYCTPQGRTLAIPLAWRTQGIAFLTLPVDTAGAMLARLRRYVLRARVELVDASVQHVVLGVGGAGAADALRAACGAAPEDDLARTAGAGGETLIRLRADLFLVVVPAGAARASWDALARRCTPASERAWHWRLVRARIPRLEQAVQDQFVPQMLALEQLGAISFDKGCYPGQEIVARAQYRGQVRRRLVAVHAGTGPLDPGQAILRSDGSSAGTVVSAAAAPEGGWDALAVLLTDAAEDDTLRLQGTGAGLIRLP
ncbi:MAG: folate-binding protein YgfZ [Burkholderiales bacterium]|nr:folate-binding protein YgfZ [Burkholderiales bacterium]